jgi:hypothetical protein
VYGSAWERFGKPVHPRCAAVVDSRRMNGQTTDFDVEPLTEFERAIVSEGE